MTAKRRSGRLVGNPTGTTKEEKEKEISVTIRFPESIKKDADILLSLTKHKSFNSLVVSSVLEYIEIYREKIDKVKEVIDNLKEPEIE